MKCLSASVSQLQAQLLRGRRGGPLFKRLTFGVVELWGHYSSISLPAPTTRPRVAEVRNAVAGLAGALQVDPARAY